MNMGPSKTEFELVLDIGLRIAPQGLGSAPQWEQANTFLDLVAKDLELGESDSSGTGWGIRDMQWIIEDTEDNRNLSRIKDKINERCRWFGFDPDTYIDSVSLNYRPKMVDYMWDPRDKDWDEAVNIADQLTDERIST